MILSRNCTIRTNAHHFIRYFSILLCYLVWSYFLSGSTTNMWWVNACMACWSRWGKKSSGSTTWCLLDFPFCWKCWIALHICMVINAYSLVFLHALRWWLFWPQTSPTSWLTNYNVRMIQSKGCTVRACTLPFYAFPFRKCLSTCDEWMHAWLADLDEEEPCQDQPPDVLRLGLLFCILRRGWGLSGCWT